MWMSILKDKLDQEEELVIRRYEEAPNSRHFYPMAKLLASRGYEDEATEMLMAGVSEHPHYTVARVLLVSYLWRKGLFVLAWKTLQDPRRGSVEDNVLAATLSFKLSVVLSSEAQARTALAHLQEFSSLDQATSELIKLYSLSGMQATRDHLLADFDPKAIELPQSYELWDEEMLRSPQDIDSGIPQKAKIQNLADATTEFHTVPLREVFLTEDASEYQDGDGKKIGAELDSFTLAEIFEKQHCYSKALEIYKRLSVSAPKHDGLRKKVLLLEKKQKEQELSNFTDVDDLISTLEDKEFMDRKQKFLENMLENYLSLTEKSSTTPISSPLQLSHE